VKLRVKALACGCVWVIYPGAFPDRPSMVFRVRDCEREVHYDDLDPVIYCCEIDVPTANAGVVGQ